MAQRIHVTEAESEVLAVLWRDGPTSPARLVEAVKARRNWGDATIKTLLGRLMRKAAVRSERDDGRLLYHAIVSRQAYVAGEVETMIDRLFEGDTNKLIAYLSQA